MNIRLDEAAVRADRRTARLRALADERILLLDGALGTMIQRCNLSESDFRGERFSSHPCLLKGCNDVLVLTQPQIVEQIHSLYLEAGADIISTDSFNANALSLADYGLSDFAYEISRRAAEIARAVADRFEAADPSRLRFVAGSVGPTNKTSSIVSDIDRPDFREISFEALADAAGSQISGLIDGGADIIIIETVFDTLNAKAILFAADRAMTKAGRRLPIMLSGTIADSSGRLLSGQTVEAFCASVSHAPLFSVGFNCAFGAEKMMPFLERLSQTAEFRISAYPNAGLPNLDGGYDETPQQFAAAVEKYLEKGLVNIVGGCCGTTPEHIALLWRMIHDYKPRRIPQPRHTTRLSGLEELKITPEINFVNIGERTNVAGSAKFARMIREGDFEGAVSVARAQVDAGAQIVDVCMDDGLIDGVAAMRRYLTMTGADPEISRVPVMIDSSSWEVLEAGLQAVQGKCIVNSLSLKDGEELFLERARAIRRYGAAVVVMLFDEQGQADTFERKTEVAGRAYKLLVDDGFRPEDIVFDPNVLTVATGIEEHDKYALAFIEAVRWIKKNLPYAKVSGGVSNLSFAFRGNNTVREAMHSVFLHHAIAAGMDMGIVNPQMLVPYELIEPELARRCEDLILCRRADASQRLAELAQRISNKAADASSHTPADEWRNAPAAERIAYAMQRGIADHIESDTLEAVGTVAKPADVIDSILMPAMEHIGVLFGEGKMFLPQVIKSASVMKRAIAVLTPMMTGDAASEPAGRVVLATVKGDVHDIGKNIVAVITACNGFEVTDLGVSVEAAKIVDEAERIGADAICLSGLITPSLEEMRRVCEEAEKRGVKIPVIVGGAATSELHTAVRIAPAYSGVVVNARNASENSRLLAMLSGAERREAARRIAEQQQALREEFERSKSLKLLSLEDCRQRRRQKTGTVKPLKTGRFLFGDVDIAEVEPYIDWNFFFSSWEVKGRIPQIFDDPKKGAEAKRIYDDARSLLQKIKEGKLLTLQAVAGIYPAASHGDDIVITGDGGKEYTLPMLRNQTAGEENLSLADYVAPQGDYIGCFALTAGVGLDKLSERLRREGDDYQSVTAKLLADRLTEALAEWLHAKVRRELWGYETATLNREEIIGERYRGRRMAFGYPASPDHSLKREVFDILEVERLTDMRLTSNWMISPGEALCGLLFADAEYFSVGRIDPQQAADYAARRGTDEQTVRKLLPYNIAE